MPRRRSHSLAQPSDSTSPPPPAPAGLESLDSGASSAHSLPKPVLPPPGSKRAKRLWHGPAVSLLELVKPPGALILEEFQLSRAARRIDAVVLYKDAPTTPSRGMLPALIDRLGEVNLIELKGGSDELERYDCVQLLSYACQFFLSHTREDIRTRLGHSSQAGPDDGAKGGEPAKTKPSRRDGERPALTLFLIAREVTSAFLAGLEERDGTLVKVGEGIWSGTLGRWPLHVLETLHVWKSDSRNGPLRVLTKEFFAHPELEIRTDDEAELYNKWSESLYNFEDWNAVGGCMAKKAAAQRPSYWEFMTELLLDMKGDSAALELLLNAAKKKGTPLPELLMSLPPEDRLRGLGAEDRLRGLGSEERRQLKALLADA